MWSMVIDARVSQSQTAVSGFHDSDGPFFYVPHAPLIATSSPGLPESDQPHTPKSRRIVQLSALAIPEPKQGEGTMLLGKRPRPPMKRTTSLSEISSDLSTTTDQSRQIAGGFSNGPDQRTVAASSTPSQTTHRRRSPDFSHTPDFLRSCSLCKRPLVPSRDIYMYRGDSAFCSVECRQQAMNRDEREENCSLASKKKIAAHHSAGSKVASNGETVGAV